eukprot:TRINITY_DN24260_c0_g1_i1.p1 TRINITY_DN24260_c0_g1~~TRINITY_DN24260_c0_g1_i1.p1  ORF type:complete len:204 (+),score=28.80 TRINITY_DN24260_c0_g1_i1:109-720(+)
MDGIWDVVFLHVLCDLDAGDQLNMRTAWSQALARCQLQVVSTASNMSDVDFSSRLGSAAARCMRLHTLLVQLRWDQSLTDKGLACLSLPPALLQLHLDFRQNRNFTDVGMTNLALCIPGSIRNLRINFSSNTNFTDAGLRALAGCVTSAVTDFALDWNGTTQVTDDGLRAIAAHLPAAAFRIALDLGWSSTLTDVGLTALAQA